jgi:hypothetical protein
MYAEAFATVNDVAYRTAHVAWVHANNPSGLNGHHPAWMAGDPAHRQGRKKQLAAEAAKMAFNNTW